MKVGVILCNGQILSQELLVCSTLRVILYPFLSSSEVGTEANISAASLAISINGIFNGLVRFIASEGIVFSRLDRKLSVAGYGLQFRHFGGQTSHVIQKWGKVARVILSITRKCPVDDFLDACKIKIPGTCTGGVNKIE